MVASQSDFRAEAMDTPEGRGIARGRYDDFMDRNLEDLVAQSIEWDNPPASADLDDTSYDVLIADAVAEAAKEESEAIGFWVAWHLAGGFAQLEAAGWHRATLYRRLHRFRIRYGQHPDEYVFPYIKLNFKRYWTDQIRRSMQGVSGSLDDLDVD